jgi:hypothetical protein
VKHSVTYIPLAHVYAVLFNTGDFYCGNICKEENEEKNPKNFVIRFSAVSVSLQSSMSESILRRPFPIPTLTCGKLRVCVCVYVMRICKMEGR